jgi:diadenosine tetraphosphate (Ap4A) HIT family hydrolase
MAAHACSECWRPADVAGLAASVLVQNDPAWLPSVLAETEACVAVQHPRPEGRLHAVLLPKRDVRNVLEITAADQPFVFGCLALGRKLAEDAAARNWRLVTNGPHLQHVTYLHFHLIAK